MIQREVEVFKSRHRRIFVGLVSIGVLAGCQPAPDGHGRTSTGLDLGKRGWTEMSDRNSIMYILEAPNVKSIQENNNFYDHRHQEKITLFPGYILYETSPNGSFGSGYGLKELFYDYINSIQSVKNKYRVTISRDDVKQRSINNKNFTYVAKEGRSGSCFVFKAFFGGTCGKSTLGSAGALPRAGGVAHIAPTSDRCSLPIPSAPTTDDPARPGPAPSSGACSRPCQAKYLSARMVPAGGDTQLGQRGS